jgi:lipopolysaccharide/colanic/teichoic acid biosynthesis glycosyltransferase
MIITTSFSKIRSFPELGVVSETIAIRSYIKKKRTYLIFKRLFDIFFSSIIILGVLSWLLPIVAILVKLDSQGPVFFIQRRVGRWGRSFSCIKFRTMVVNELANVKQASENDTRITKIGRFLRRSNLDEFPQFFNVLVGHMSIVGPRPHMHADCRKFSKAVAGYKFRSMLKPGITGLAQVKGYRGPTKNFVSIFHRYQLDAFYVRNANFWLDMRIIRKTAGQTIRGLFSKMFQNSAPAETNIPASATPVPEWAPSFKSIQN